MEGYWQVQHTLPETIMQKKHSAGCSFVNVSAYVPKKVFFALYVFFCLFHCCMPAFYGFVFWEEVGLGRGI
jgi:hypothetical protein